MMTLSVYNLSVDIIIYIYMKKKEPGIVLTGAFLFCFVFEFIDLKGFV